MTGSGGAATTVLGGVCYAIFVYDTARAIDLDAAERRLEILDEQSYASPPAGNKLTIRCGVK